MLHRFPAWPAWAAIAALALLATFLALNVNRLDHEVAFLNNSLALSDAQLRSLDATLESERIVSKAQTIRLKETQARLAATPPPIARLQVLSLHAPSSGSTGATGTIIWDAGTRDGVLVANRLPPMAFNQVYRLTFLGGDSPVSIDTTSHTESATDSRIGIRIPFTLPPGGSIPPDLTLSLETLGDVSKPSVVVLSSR